jgi:cyclopropane fatty-acyl-phospholipid synthase-like methyltransferase
MAKSILKSPSSLLGLGWGAQAKAPIRERKGDVIAATHSVKQQKTARPISQIGIFNVDQRPR